MLIGLTAAPACSNTAGVSEVFMSLDNDGSRRRTEFYTDTQEIHCIVKGAFGRPDVTIHGSFHQISRFNFDADKPDFEKVDRYIGDADIHPQLNKDSKEQQLLDIKLLKVNAQGQTDEKAPYPAGSYECIVTLDGERVTSKGIPFNINIPDACPATTITPKSLCKGFYPLDKTCKIDGDDNNDNEDDTCDCKATGWDCGGDKK